MPGPYYSNPDDDIILAGPQQSAPREYPVWGHPPAGGTLLSEGAIFDSLALRIAIEQARALEYALTGAENNGEVAAPSGGHRHNEDFYAAMPWCQIESYRFTTMQHGPGTTHVGWSYIVDSATFVDVLFVPLVVRDGIVAIVPRIWMAFAAGAANKLTLQFDYYDPADLTTVAVSGGQITREANPSVFDGYIDMDWRGIDVSGIPKTGDVRLVYLRVQAKVDTGVAGLRQIQLMGSDQGYAPRPARAPLDTTRASGDVALSHGYLNTLYRLTPERLRTLTFGDTFGLPTRSRAHDHAEGRGEHLRRHLLSMSFGPHSPDGSGATSGGTIGVPLQEPTAGFDFLQSPKLLARIPLFVPGTYAPLKVVLAGHLAGVLWSCYLKVEVRPMREDFATAGAGTGIASDLQLTASTDGFAAASVDLDLTPLGDVSQDRWYELVIYHHDNPPATETYRLTGVAVYEDTEPDEATLEEDLHYPAREELAVANFRTQTEVTNLLTAQMARVQNQLGQEVLGGTPGWISGGEATNTAKAWRRLLKGRHQHRGSFTNAAGQLIDDGAVLRMPLFTQVYLTNIKGSGVEGATVSDVPPLGHRIHSSSSLSSSTWPEFEAWVTLPQGCRGIDLYGLIQPGTPEPSGRLYCVVLVNPNDVFDEDISIVSYTSAQNVEATDNASTRLASTAFQHTEVLPQESAAWAANERRLMRGLGCWTTDALRRSFFNGDKLTTNPARWTQPIRIAIAPTYSGSHLLRVQWALQLGDRARVDDGTYATGARLLAMTALPARLQ